MASLAIVLLSGCSSNEEKPAAPVESSATSSVESSAVGESSHIEITLSSSSGVSSTESVVIGDSGVSSETISTPVQSSSTVNPDEPAVSSLAFGTVIDIKGEIFDTKWSFEEVKNHGWSYEPSDEIVRPNRVGMFQILLTKGNKSVYATVFNVSESGKPALECEIIGAVSLDKGATIGTGDSSVQIIVGENLDTTKLTMCQASSVETYHGYESFTVPTDDGTLYFYTYDSPAKIASVGITHKASNGQTFIE